jgi:hypothetical protein
MANDEPKIMKSEDLAILVQQEGLDAVGTPFIVIQPEIGAEQSNYCVFIAQTSKDRVLDSIKRALTGKVQKYGSNFYENKEDSKKYILKMLRNKF